jgi:hypothetical protein
MIPALQLWLPILLSAVFVFIASSVIHMVLPYHRNDFRRLEKEDEVMDALRPFGIEPGEYVFPHMGEPKECESDAFKEKLSRGPVGFLTVMSGEFEMGKSLLLWFIYCLLIGLFAAYVGGLALEPDAHYLAVFRIIGTVAFGAYALALLQNSIWYKRAWGTTLKSVADGFIYAAITAGTFGWLWP